MDQFMAKFMDSVNENNAMPREIDRIWLPPEALPVRVLENSAQFSVALASVTEDE
jgi:hypothetical protein